MERISSPVAGMIAPVFFSRETGHGLRSAVASLSSYAELLIVDASEDLVKLQLGMLLRVLRGFSWRTSRLDAPSRWRQKPEFTSLASLRISTSLTAAAYNLNRSFLWC